jgi:hypothetical protein
LQQRKFIALDHPMTMVDFLEVPVSKELHAAMQSLNREDIAAFCQNLRLLFRSRIVSCQGDELLKLQGKIEATSEIEGILLDMLKP